jgi:hypothetical protein
MLFSSEVSLVILGAASCSSHGNCSKIKNVSEYIDTKCKEIIFQGNMYQLRRAQWGSKGGCNRSATTQRSQRSGVSAFTVFVILQMVATYFSC